MYLCSIPHKPHLHTYLNLVSVYSSGCVYHTIVVYILTILSIFHTLPYFVFYSILFYSIVHYKPLSQLFEGSWQKNVYIS